MSVDNGAAGDVQQLEYWEKLQFPKIVDGQIDTVEFLEASRGVVRMIEKFGKLFAPVKYDMQGNINKLNTKYQQDKANHKTLQQIVLREKDKSGKLVAIDALLWLRRGLHMILLFFKHIVEDWRKEIKTIDLTDFLTRAYTIALQPYHGWMAQQMFSLLSKMVPSRPQLLLALADGQPGKETKILSSIEKLLVSLEENVLELTDFYDHHGLNNESKV